MDIPVIIEVCQLSKIYGSGQRAVFALKEIDLKVAAGESLAIMGPSGSGKSTLLHLLGCLDTPTEGTYLLNGQDVSRLSDTALAAVRATQIGFVFQAFNLIAQLNVYENVELPFMYQSPPVEGMRDKIWKAIDRVGLSHRLNHLPSELSGGEMQRVAIARALAINPLLILADEPTGNLDSATARSIMELFKELNAQGVTLLLITHDAQIGAYCQRLVSMRDGIIIHDGKTL
jgi:putative ABC transport system ATP-binding protein